jgi:hypothetical protein
VLYIYTPDHLTLSGNTAKHCYDDAFEVGVNNNPIITNNVGADTAFDYLMYVQCNTSCGSGQISNNKLTGAGDEYQGLSIDNGSGGSGFSVVGNTITDVQGHGIEVTGGSNHLSGNKVYNAGVADGYFGIFLNSSSNTLTGSTITGGFDNAIEIAGDSNNVYSNLNLTGNGEDGIHVASGWTGNTLNGNTVKSNHGEGIENDGTSTVISSNTSSGNRQDCAGIGSTNPAGVAADPASGGNTCADHSDFTWLGPITKPTAQLKHHQGLAPKNDSGQRPRPTRPVYNGHHVASPSPNTRLVMPIK